MGVLESMRSSSDSTGMQVVLVLVVISFIGWYAVPQGEKTTIVAKVNGTAIMDTEYRQLYSSSKAEQERRLDRPLSTAEEQSIGESTRQQLIRNEVIMQAAADMGVEVSNYELQWENVRTGQYVGYVDETGKLDREKYQRYLTRRGLTEGRYESQLKQSLTMQKMRQLVYLGTSISEPVLKKLYEQNQRQVDVTYVRVRPSAFFSALEVSDADVDAWLVEHEARANEIYTRDFETVYKYPEQLELSLIKMNVGGEATAADLVPRMNNIRAELDGGADFETLARKWSEDPSAETGGNLGLKPITRILPGMLIDVADLKEGETSRVLTQEKDLRIYRVHKRVEASEDTFEVAKRKIARAEIRKEKAPVMAVDFAEKELLAQWKASGTVPEALIAEKGLTSSATGLKPTTAPPGPLGPPAEMLARAADLPEGTVIGEVFESGGNYWVGQVTQRKEADMALFEAQRETIRGQELLTRRGQFLEAWVTDQVARATVE